MPMTLSIPRKITAALAAVLLSSSAPAPSPADGPADPRPLTFHLRSQQETAAGSGKYRSEVVAKTWDLTRTAVVVCDMWDRHWSVNATKRVGEMAPRMNELLVALRSRGALIIHCPSDTMGFYKDTPQRARAKDATRAEPKVPLKSWVGLDRTREPALPIDDSDGGDDSEPKGSSSRAWSRQIDVLKIEPEDAITDNAEAYNLIRQRGIEHVLVMGVHLNMCVLGRPFAIRQLVSQGLDVALVRDMTDTMYNPQRSPQVSHFAGTDLMIEHVERHWCPTLTSDDVLGGQPFRFAGDDRPQAIPATR